MKYTSYAARKKEYDDRMFLYIAKRLFDDLDDSDAAHEDIIDGVGNVLKNPDATNDWAFTSMDRLLLMMRQQLGEDELRAMLGHYEFAKEIDPLFIMSHESDYDYQGLREVLGAIVTKVEDKSYLPDYLYHDNDEEYIEEEDGMNFTDKVRRALTIATYLLYGIRNGSMPSTSHFEQNVCPSVELTFGVRPWGTHEDCVKYCDEHGLTEYRNITGEGIRLLVTLAKLFDGAGLLLKDSSRVENQTRNWTKLANERL
jgi:hypothetical protein